MVGSELIGQTFANPAYVQGRLSAAGNGYDATASSGSNLGPTSKKLRDRVAADVDRLRKDNPDAPLPIPAELVTASASGLDPEVSPQAALWQVPRIARARQVAPERITQVLESRVQGRDLGVFGEPRVNVLAVNRALDCSSASRRLSRPHAPDLGGEVAPAPAHLQIACARRRPCNLHDYCRGSERWRRAVRRQSSSHSGNSSASAACSRQNSRTERPGAGSQTVFRFSIVRW